MPYWRRAYVRQPRCRLTSGGLAARRHAHPGLVLLIIAGAQLMVVLDGTIVNIALPSMGRYFNKSQTDMTWALNAYTLAFGGMLLLGGRSGDILGRRRMFMVGLTLFTLGSFGAGLATNFTLLLVGRVVQGLGGAISAPNRAVADRQRVRGGTRPDPRLRRLRSSLRSRRCARPAARRHPDQLLHLALGAVRQRPDRHPVDHWCVLLRPPERAPRGSLRLRRLASLGGRARRRRLRVHPRREHQLGQHPDVPRLRCGDRAADRRSCSTNCAAPPTR